MDLGGGRGGGGGGRHRAGRGAGAALWAGGQVAGGGGEGERGRRRFALQDAPTRPPVREGAARRERGGRAGPGAARRLVPGVGRRSRTGVEGEATRGVAGAVRKGARQLQGGALLDPGSGRRTIRRARGVGAAAGGRTGAGARLESIRPGGGTPLGEKG